MRRIFLYCLGLFIWLPGKINAQRVIYSESVNSRGSVRFQMIGKSENFYWVAKLQQQKTKWRHEQERKIEIQDFELFDNRLHLLSEQSPVYIPGTMKQWLMTGNKGLDQVVSVPSGKNTRIFCNRYQSNQNAESRLIDSLPFPANASSILLVRSENQSLILLIAFENTDPESTFVHIHLFDSGWNPVYRKVISNIQFSQPCIQDDEVGFPSEGFDNLPVKLANNGEWAMVYPSRISHHFSLFHACPNGEDYFFKEIMVAPFYKMEDISMSIDNDRQQMTIGLLSAYRNTSLKNVQVCNYSMREGRFDFDTSYHFNEQSRDISSKNLSHESFISVPQGGYMLLKEYGSTFEFEKPNIPALSNWEAAYLLANYSEANSGEKEMKQGYKLNRGLSPISAVRNKGDLNLFYFPAVSNDSTWSAVLEMEQHSETNNPDLSYLLLPAKNKLYLIYNSQDGSSDPLATATTLNTHGETTGDGLVFWKMDKMLNFQNARRFTADEVVVPYLDNQ
ncbi:MAG TPA: hypothetical protein VHT72_02690, partial [Puia sp.]|nr:hypothetical protein [Puia sp.]